MKLLILVVLAACVIGSQAACSYTLTEVCTVGDACDVTANNINYCASDTLDCVSSKCELKPVLGGSCTTNGADCFNEYGRTSDCVSSTCKALNYKNGDATCSASNECISGSCTGGKCYVRAKDESCTNNNQCVGGEFCQMTTTTSAKKCTSIYAADATCYSTSDICAPGYTCTAINVANGANTAGKCVAWWSVAKDGQCSAHGQCEDGLVCDGVSTSGTFHKCKDPDTTSATCSITSATCAGNAACDQKTCSCVAIKEEKNSGLADALKSLATCLDDKKCKAANANADSCGLDCLSQAKEVGDNLSGEDTATVRGWTLGPDEDACDSASVASVSFVLVVLMALFSL